MPFSILQINSNSVVDDEQLGSKDKFWFELEGQFWLFKEARTIQTAGGSRVVTGEDWAEKAAAEIAAQIGVNAARVELAEYEGLRGSASLNFMPVDRTTHLEHGNEVLGGRVLDYDPDKKQKQSDHTIDNIVAAIQTMVSGAESTTLLSALAGYLVLDALICNTDRHHENWGLFWKTMSTEAAMEDWETSIPVRAYVAAPTFDHASSLGRELLDEKRRRIIDQGRIEAYVRKGRGGVYRRTTDSHGENPLQLVEFAARRYPDFFMPALGSISAVPLRTLQGVFDEIPDTRISATGREFAKLMLQVTYHALLGLTK
ncbi:MAG TPA: HipA domain-containing protein [Rhodocyclaceae bacterium]|nr:HipA domain-containing protein [Rhodocyclaceae bacterium]